MTMLELFENLAFPLGMCLLMAWYVKYMSDNHRADINSLHQQHREAENRITEAINNNTIIMTKICERLGDVDDSNN